MAPPFAAWTLLLLGLSGAVAADPQSEDCDCRACTEVVARQAKEIARLQDELRSLRGQVDPAGRRLDSCYRDWRVESDTDVEAFRLEGCHDVMTLSIGGFRASWWDVSYSNISSLTGLSSLKTADSLTIGYTTELQSLDGLQGLTRVDELRIEGNQKLTSIGALRGLETVKDLYVNGNFVGQLQSLDGLQGVRHLEKLCIQGHDGLWSLDGLQGLTRVDELRIEANQNLTSIGALQGLETAKVVHIITNYQLPSLDGLQGLRHLELLDIQWNSGLRSLDGLQGLRHVEDPSIQYNSGLRSLDGLQGLENVTGYFWIGNNEQLQSLDGLQGLAAANKVGISTNDQLQSLDGLQGLKTLKEASINYNGQLQSFNGLQGLRHLETLEIESNPGLMSLDGLQGVRHIEKLGIHYNDGLRSLNGLQGLETATSVRITGHVQLQSLDGLQSVRHIGELDIRSNEGLMSLNGLQGLRHVEELLDIFGNSRLMSLDGLQGLETVKGLFEIAANILLQSADGLQGLRHVEQLKIDNNKGLRSLDGLQGLETATEVRITGEVQLQSLDGLQGLRNVKQLYIGLNSGLRSLDGLQGLAEVGSLTLSDLPELRSIAALSGLTRAWLGGISISLCDQLHSLAGLGVGMLHVSLLEVANTPLEVLGGPFATGSTVHVASFDEESWPPCFTLHERTSFLSVVGDVLTSSVPNATWSPECGTDFGTISCTMGHPCNFSLAEERSNYTRVFVSARFVGCGNCSSNDPQGDVAEGGRVDLGYALRDEEAGLHSVCQCAGAIGPVAQLSLRGPRKGLVQACSRGRNCTFRLKGEGLERTDRVVLVTSCRSSDPSLGFVPSFTADSSYRLHEPSTWYDAPAAQYEVCWRAPCSSVVDGPTCPAPEDSYFHVGNIELLGAYPRDYTAVLGEQDPFTVPNIGSAVSDGDWMRLRRACSDADEGYVLAANSTGMVFDFGRLTEDRVEAGWYRLCWCHGSDGAQCNAAWHFMAHAGVVEIRCPAGKGLVDSRRCESCPPGKQQPGPGLNPCLDCPVGQFSQGGDELCEVCPNGEVARVRGRSTCVACRPWQSADADLAGCIANPVMLVLLALLSLFLGAISAVLMHSIRGQLLVVDVSLLDEQQTIVKTFGPHGLANFGRPSFPVKLHGTCHPGLDSPSEPLRARVKDAVHLELLTSANASIKKRLDTSMGTLTVDFPHDLRHQLIVVFGLPLLLTAAGALGVLALYFGLMEDALLWAATPVALTCAATAAALRRWRLRAMPTPLDVRLREFEVEKLGERLHGVARTAKGPNRAIALGKLYELLAFFHDFIRDRNAYYLDSNVLTRLTSAQKVSYAELVGAETVEWFVSHYWGTPFAHFCLALEKHAETVCGQSDWRSLKYWVCFCSNNQHQIEDELGGEAGWVESSFYLTLHSGQCRGTCMVLDDKALPLTRIWCIFELLQTVKLERNQDTFQGLLLCTSSGVLNTGGGSAEVAMALGDRVARMNLETAQSSSASDKAMICTQVAREMGSFNELNRFICGEMHAMLVRAQQHANQHFADVLAHLGQSMTTNGFASV